LEAAGISGASQMISHNTNCFRLAIRAGLRTRLQRLMSLRRLYRDSSFFFIVRLFLRVGEMVTKSPAAAATGPMKRILWHRAVSPQVAGIW
jgi:hypothetical protein